MKAQLKIIFCIELFIIYYNRRLCTKRIPMPWSLVRVSRAIRKQCLLGNKAVKKILVRETQT